jgi:peptidyl-prolyl cis-trans isomerase SurA
VRNIGRITTAFALTTLVALGLTACSDRSSDTSKDNSVAATVNGKPIMSAEVERLISQQAGGKQSQLSQLELAQARLQALDNLIQTEVLSQRADKENLRPTEDQINGAINEQMQNAGMTAEDFAKSLKEQNMTMEALRETARKELAIKALQDKYGGKISISNREVEDFYNTNRTQFVNARGVQLAMIMVDPADNSAQGIQNDAKSETDAKVKIDNINQQLKSGKDFATIARALSEDPQSGPKGGDIGFFTEDNLKQAGFPPDLVSKFFGPMQIGERTDPIKFNNGKWYLFKLEDKRLQTENLTLESPGVRQQITQNLINKRKDIVNAALLEVAMFEAKIVNNMAADMINNPSNLGLRPAEPGTVQSPAGSPAASASASPKATATGAASPAPSPTKK